MTLIGVISDTHGILRPRVREIFKDCELIIHAGDIGKIEVYDELQLIAPVIAIKGNIDRDELAQRFRHTELVRVLNSNIFIIHDISQLNITTNELNVNIIIYGHSHKASVKKINGILYFNPGSAGPRRFKLPVTAGLLKITDENIEPQIIELTEN